MPPLPLPPLPLPLPLVLSRKCAYGRAESAALLTCYPCVPGAALVAMIGSEGLMANLSVFGALFGSWWVVNAQIFRRYYPDVKLRFTRWVPLLP